VQYGVVVSQTPLNPLATVEMDLIMAQQKLFKEKTMKTCVVADNWIFSR